MQSTEPEIWLPVVGCEGIYEVSNRGRVRSLERTDHRGHRIQGKMLKPVSHTATGPGARQTISIHREGKQQTRLVHHLVLEAFVGGMPDGMEACHGDGDASNNHLSNLRWDTHISNEADKARHGTHEKANRAHCPRGHSLAAPNIGEYEAKRGHRKCRACSIAHSRAHYRNQPFDDAYADEVYARVLNGEMGSSKPACKRGHLLQEPNLVRIELNKHGKRVCLACRRAKDYAKNHKSQLSDAVADERYRSIMGVADGR